MTNEKEWKPMPEREDAWITDYAFEAAVEVADDEESHDSTVQVIELQNVYKIVAEATRRGKMEAWEEAKMILVPHQQFAADHPYREVRKKLFKAVEAKLTSLKTP